MIVKKKFKPPGEEDLILELRPWVKGFVIKEYGFLEPSDQEELEQDGCLNLLLAIRKLQKKSPDFPDKEEYILYLKAMVRNAIRDCVLKLRSRFNISLFKLRRQLREKDTTLNEYMASIGDEYEYVTDITESMEEKYFRHGREKLLDVLTPARRGCKDMTIEECRDLLKNVIGRLSPEAKERILNKKCY